MLSLEDRQELRIIKSLYNQPNEVHIDYMSKGKIYRAFGWHMANEDYEFMPLEKFSNTELLEAYRYKRDGNWELEEDIPF